MCPSLQVLSEIIPSCTSGNLPTLTVAQFKTSFRKATSTAVKIKARCTGTLEKLTYEEDQWRLLVSVEDSTGNMAVYFSNEARARVASMASCGCHANRGCVYPLKCVELWYSSKQVE